MKKLKRTLIIVLTMANIGVLAYLSASDFKRNSLTNGNVTVEIEETFTPPVELEPGITFPKEITIKNASISSCYIRCLLEFTSSDMEAYVTLDYNTEAWEKGADDYWYYKAAINKGEKTSPLITEVKIADGAPQTVIDDFALIVYAEAWQAKGHETYRNAWDFAVSNKK